MTDCCIIGGGIIGLSLARELSGRGMSVRLLAREPHRATASWAAAGIFPPAPWSPDCGPGDALTAWSDQLHRAWADDLRAETGIDNGLRACGGLHLATSSRGLERIGAEAAAWRARGTPCDLLTAPDVAACEPALRAAVARGRITGGMLLPAETQLRPPRHLAALEQSCLQRGVVISRPATVREFLTHGDQIDHVVADIAGTPEAITSGSFVLAAGAWSQSLADHLGLQIATRPVRGQIALVRLPSTPVSRVVNRGLDYLVPRDDGRLLVGSTLEDVGFDPSTTDEAVTRLLALAHELLGDLPNAVLEQAWAGLRPGSVDGLPTIGRIPGLTNALVAAGHFRAGLHQSTGTAVMIADLIEGRTSPVAPMHFAVDRPPAQAIDAVDAHIARVMSESA
jgi:glycine oxidase